MRFSWASAARLSAALTALLFVLGALLVLASWLSIAQPESKRIPRGNARIIRRSIMAFLQMCRDAGRSLSGPAFEKI
jgi:hypothetical protein